MKSPIKCATSSLLPYTPLSRKADKDNLKTIKHKNIYRYFLGIRC